MAEDHDVLVLITERFEHRLTAETSALRLEMTAESGKLRTEMAQGFGQLRAEMTEGFGRVRADMIDRNAELLKWALVFGVTQTAAVAGIVALLR